MDFFDKLAIAFFLWGLPLAIIGSVLRLEKVGSRRTAVLTQCAGLTFLALCTLVAVLS